MTETLLEMLYTGNVITNPQSSEFVPNVHGLSDQWVIGCQALRHMGRLPSNKDPRQARIHSGDRRNIRVNGDPTADLSRRQMTERVNRGVSNITREAIYYSGETLYFAANCLLKQAERQDKDIDRAQIVRQAIGAFRQPFARHLLQAKARSVFSIDKDYVGPVPKTFSVRADSQTPLSFPAAWLENSTEWDPALQGLCAFKVELDTLLAAQEWVLARNLPYIPMMAPKNAESGLPAKQFAGEDDSDIERLEGNPHADVLLCSLASDSIIPVQVKNHLGRDKRARYNAGVEMVRPQDLGNMIISHAPLEIDGKVKTARHVQTLYGDITNQWCNAYLSEPSKSKARRRLLGERLGAAFERFDMFADLQPST